jgi:GTPase SAR1 family protein
MKEENFHLISPKKLIIFGASKSGKSSFAQFLGGNKYEEIRNGLNDKDNGKKK